MSFELLVLLAQLLQELPAASLMQSLMHSGTTHIA